VLNGLIVTVLIVGAQLRPYRRTRFSYPLVLPPTSRGLLVSPQGQSLNRRLRDSFVVFALAALILLITVSFLVSLRLSTNMVVIQMAKDAEDVSSRIPDFRDDRQHLLSQYSALLNGNEAESETLLRQLFRTGDYFRRVMLVDESLDVDAFYPPDISAVILSSWERTAINDSLATSAPFIGSAQQSDSAEELVSFVVPVMDGSGQPEAALIGRVSDISLSQLIAGLQGTAGEGEGFLVDEQGRILAHPDPAVLGAVWNPPTETSRLIRAEGPGTAYEGRASDTNVRELVYYQQGPNHPWTVVVTVPYTIVLQTALRIGASMFGIGAVSLALLGIYLLVVGRSITGPLEELMVASQSIAGGSLNTPIRAKGEDELGRLAQAFGQMQIALKKRLDEQALLVSVSQEVSASMDINKGMPAILLGALRGTGAAGVRVVVFNPNGGRPLTFGQGPAHRAMLYFDRQLMDALRQEREMVLATPEAVAASLTVPEQRDRELPFKSVIALPLHTEDRFQGIFWLAFRQPREFDQAELNLVRTLAGQAAVLVQNAWLFASAEGGRRRLAAVLASTNDAMIVTDQTNRILWINPAMEHAFGLRAAEVRGLPVADVIRSDRLREALTSEAERARNVEVRIADGRTLYAVVSTVINNDGQAIGRVGA
jgi:PAS domain S-box-containing protein